MVMVMAIVVMMVMFILMVIVMEMMVTQGDWCGMEPYRYAKHALSPTERADEPFKQRGPWHRPRVTRLRHFNETSYHIFVRVHPVKAWVAILHRLNFAQVEEQMVLRRELPQLPGGAKHAHSRCSGTNCGRGMRRSDSFLDASHGRPPSPTFLPAAAASAERWPYRVHKLRPIAGISAFAASDKNLGSVGILVTSGNQVKSYVRDTRFDVGQVS